MCRHPGTRRLFATAIVLTVGAIPLGSEPIRTAYDTDGTILVDGKRTLILGTYMVGNRYTAPNPTLEHYRELAHAGFNLVRASAEHMDLALEAGLLTWTDAGTLDLNDPDGSAQAIIRRVEAVRDHPSLAFLETTDEPAWTWMKAEPRVPAEALVRAYPIIKQTDPNHLLYTNHAPTNLESTLQRYNEGTDIVAVDIYPVNPGGLKPQYALFEDGYQGDLNNIYISQVGEYADKMRRVASPNRPVFMVLQAFAWEMLLDEAERRPEKIKYPSFEESRFMAFQSLIHGANGLIYWGSYYTPQPSDCWDGIKRVVREIADLSGPLTQRRSNATIRVTYHEVGHSVDDGVQWLAKEHEGRLYLFTCNADKNPCTATLAGLGGWQSCEVVNESRSLPLEDGALTDSWKPFDVHIYRFTK